MQKQTEKSYGHGERGGEGEMYGKSNMETYITIWKIDSQWEFAVCLRKLKQGLCTEVKNLPANAGDTGDAGLFLGREDPWRRA